MRKSILKTPRPPPGIRVTAGKNILIMFTECVSISLGGESTVMRKEMKGDCFLPSALSTQLILLGGQIAAVPAEGEQQNESDQSESK